MNRRQLISASSALLAIGYIRASGQDQPLGPAKKLPVEGIQFEVSGRPAFLIESKKNVGSGPKKWVWYAPTLRPYPGPEERWMIERFLDAGISVAGIDVGESYGSPAGRVQFSAFFDELTGHRGFSKKPSLLGRSRGGLMLYNWAADHPQNVGCIAGIYPVCNLESWPGLEKSAPAYGLTAGQLKSQLREHNPIDRLSGLATQRVPIFHIHGDSDTVVPLEANSGTIAARYKDLGGSMTLVVPKGQGHNMWTGFFQCQELVDFIIKNSASV